MRIRTVLLLLAFVVIGSIHGCNCGDPYITSPDADATATDTPPPPEAVE